LGRRRGPPAVRISDERAALLDTGGGVSKALPLLGPEPFLVLNCDALWSEGPEGPLARLAGTFASRDMDVLLLVVERRKAHNFEGPGDFEMAADSRLARRSGSTAPYVYAGVQILQPSVFEGCAVEAFSLNRIYDAAARRGRLFGCLHDGAWFHVGTPEAVGETERLLKG